MKIKYPRFHITDHATEFYVWYQESESSHPMWSDWIKGDSDLWYKLQNMKKKDQQEAIIKLATKKGR